MAETERRPFGVTLLAVLAGLAALVALWHTLQMLHILPIRLGEHRFFTFDLIGAFLWGFMVLIYLWAVRALWSVDPQGWLFLAVISSFSLVLDFVSLLGQSTLSAMWPSIVVNAVILIYVLRPRTREAFGVGSRE